MLVLFVCLFRICSFSCQVDACAPGSAPFLLGLPSRSVFFTCCVSLLPLQVEEIGGQLPATVTEPGLFTVLPSFDPALLEAPPPAPPLPSPAERADVVSHTQFQHPVDLKLTPSVRLHPLTGSRCSGAAASAVSIAGSIAGSIAVSIVNCKPTVLASFFGVCFVISAMICETTLVSFGVASASLCNNQYMQLCFVCLLFCFVFSLKHPKK